MYPRRLLLPLLLLTACCAFGRESGESWVEVRSPHFVVLSNTTEKQARHIAGQFERMRSVFQASFPKAKIEAESTIFILAVKDKKDFQTLEPASYLAKGQTEEAGVFLPTPDKTYILLRLDVQGEHPYATVYRDYTRLLLRDSAPWLPLWLHEGLAGFFQNTQIHEKDAQLGEPNPQDILFLRQNRLLPFETLLAVDAKSPYASEDQKGSIFYAESWALTHLLQMTDKVDHTHRLADYIDLVGQHVNPVTAGERAFGDLPQLQKALESYLALPTLRYFRVDVPAAVDETTYTASELPLPGAEAVQADFLAYNDRGKDARTLLETVLRDDPKNAEAHETMGYLELQAGNIEAARNWYEQALLLDPTNYLAQYYFAVVSIRMGTVTPPERIEASLRAAIKLNPKFAPAYDELAAFYGKHKERLDEAHLLELRAVALDPGNLEYRLNTAVVLQDAQRNQDALNVLHAAVGLPKTPEEAATLAARTKALEQYQAQVSATSKPAEEQSKAAAGASGSASAMQKHPTEEPRGPKLLAKGVIQGVRCTDPSEIELKVVGGGRNYSLYSNNYFQVSYSAANFTPEGEIHPCSDLEGMTANVQYSATSDKTVDGQILSVQLSK